MNETLYVIYETRLEGKITKSERGKNKNKEAQVESK